MESFGKAKDVFSYEYGLTHPRTAIVIRNLARVRQRRLDFSGMLRCRAAVGAGLGGRRGCSGHLHTSISKAARRGWRPVREGKQAGVWRGGEDLP